MKISRNSWTELFIPLFTPLPISRLFRYLKQKYKVLYFQSGITDTRISAYPMTILRSSQYYEFLPGFVILPSNPNNVWKLWSWKENNPPYFLGVKIKLSILSHYSSSSHLWKTFEMLLSLENFVTKKTGSLTNSKRVN